MNKFFYFSIALFWISMIHLPTFANIFQTSRSFLFLRPIYHNLLAEQYLWINMINDKLSTNEQQVQAIIMGQGFENHGLSDIAKYFLIKCKTELLIAGDNINLNRDVRAEWIGLSPDFQSKMKLCPKSKQIGILFFYNIFLGQIFDNPFVKDFWAQISLPFIFMEQKINFESDLQVLKAFNQSNWIAAKIPTQTFKINTIPELKLKVGTTMLSYDNFLIDIAAGFIVPTSKRNVHEFLFSPVPVIDSPIAFCANVDFIMPFFRSYEPVQPKLFLLIESAYYLKSTQLRSFDLIEKEWSKYMRYRKFGQIETTQGVNILTLPASVHPHSFTELVAGLEIELQKFKVAFGYKFWAHERESIELKAPACEGNRFIFEDYGIAGSAPEKSASESTINCLAADDEFFTTININDINLASGASPGTFVNGVFFTIAFDGVLNFHKFFLNLGVLFESPNNNAAAKNLSEWFKFGVEF